MKIIKTAKQGKSHQKMNKRGNYYRILTKNKKIPINEVDLIANQMSQIIQIKWLDYKRLLHFRYFLTKR